MITHNDDREAGYDVILFHGENDGTPHSARDDDRMPDPKENARLGHARGELSRRRPRTAETESSGMVTSNLRRTLSRDGVVISQCAHLVARKLYRAVKNGGQLDGIGGGIFGSDVAGSRGVVAHPRGAEDGELGTRRSAAHPRRGYCQLLRPDGHAKIRVERGKDLLSVEEQPARSEEGTQRYREVRMHGRKGDVEGHRSPTMSHKAEATGRNRKSLNVTRPLTATGATVALSRNPYFPGVTTSDWVSRTPSKIMVRRIVVVVAGTAGA